MTQNLTPAQQAQTDNRDDSGKWKSKTHADVDDTGEVLGLSEDPTSDNEEPLSFREAVLDATLCAEGGGTVVAEVSV